MLLWISIHAAREGGDQRALTANGYDVGFQSTPPVKAATNLPPEIDARFIISIHAAREGGDPVLLKLRQLPIKYFNPRRP